MASFRKLPLLVAAPFLAACAPAMLQTPEPAAPPQSAAPADTARPAVPPPPTARTVEQFDTTTAEERAEVVKAAEPGAGRVLGTTIASLGDPAEPGFWLKTPLVQIEQPGRVEYDAAGTSVLVTLIPIEGPKTGGSRLSLAAMRLLQAPLTGLPEITVLAAK